MGEKKKHDKPAAVEDKKKHEVPSPEPYAEKKDSVEVPEPVEIGDTKVLK